MIVALRSELARYLRTETVGGALLLVAAAVALLWANSPWRDSYFAMVDTPLAIPPLHLDLTLVDWIEDGLLAEHWDVIQDEATREDSKSGLPMLGDTFPTRV